MTLYTPDQIRASRRRTGLWLMGTGLYGALTSLACLALLVTR